MTFPWWQRWWSYLKPITIERIPSEINESLDVLLVRGRLQLCTDNAVYSFEKKYENFRQVFDKLKFDQLSGGKVLVLGLGLGSIVQLLEDKRKDFEYTVVELDEDVIYLAEKFVLNKIKAKVDTICMSGDIFCHSTSEKYDLICMDIFIDDWIPDEFLTSSFCESLKAILNKDGLLIYNTPAFSEKSSKHSSLFYKHHFKKVFEKGMLMDVHKNFMLLSDTHLLETHK